MDRREFIKQMGLGLAAGWAGVGLNWPWRAQAAVPDLRLALLADAHLKDGDPRRPQAIALARAVAEIRSQSPRPDLVLFTGDLAHRGRPDALDLGREILSDLPGPVWAVPGEGDHGPRGNSAWGRRFGASRFCRALRGAQVIGLDTILRHPHQGAVFEVGAAQLQWLGRELATLDPATPLVVVSHAPLARFFRPWQQWTADAPEIFRLLSRFHRVLCLHGHVHAAGVRGAGVGGRGTTPPPALLGQGGMPARPLSGEGEESGIPPETIGYLEGLSGGWVNCQNVTPDARCPENLVHYGLPATAWPLPLAIQGTPAVPRPGLGPHGCGWALITLNSGFRSFQPYLWQS